MLLRYTLQRITGAGIEDNTLIQTQMSLFKVLAQRSSIRFGVVHVTHFMYVSVCIVKINSYLIFSSQSLVNILKQKDIEANPDNLIEYLRPFRIIISLLDKSEIGKDTHMVFKFEMALLWPYLTRFSFSHSQGHWCCLMCCWRWSELFTATVK